jgi:hypothetical protein
MARRDVHLVSICVACVSLEIQAAARSTVNGTQIRQVGETSGVNAPTEVTDLFSTS